VTSRQGLALSSRSSSFHSARSAALSDRNLDVSAALELEGCSLSDEATMKAWTLSDYAEPATAVKQMTLREDVAIPKPNFGEVRVKISHAAVNPIDWKLFDGASPLFAAHAPYTPGFDFAGVVESAGDGTELEVGEKVIGYIGLTETCSPDGPPSNGHGSAGAFAQYCCIPESRLAVVPGYSDARKLSGLPLAGLTAFQALFTGRGGVSLQGTTLGDLRKGQKVLVLGGSSSTGFLAVQLANAAGAEVVATASDAVMPDGKQTKMDWVKSLGAHRLINYKKQDWSEVLGSDEERFDMIFDTVGSNDDLAKAGAILKEGAPFVSTANFDPKIPEGAAFRFASFIVHSDGRDLADLVTLVEQRKLSVLVDSVFEFEEAREALERSMTGRATGKIIVEVDDFFASERSFG